MTRPSRSDLTKRHEPPFAGSEAEALLGALDRQRATLAWKCSGVDAAGMRATVGASTVTLGGLLKHLAQVERSYLTRLLLDQPVPSPWDDHDWAWRTAADDSADELLDHWAAAVERSREIVAAALEKDGDPGQPGRYTAPGGDSPNLRRILLDMIEEYARHVGHADLIRESVDGLVGEDPPE